jgi:ABC-type nitrate/sulfonate/bicarbonate transport system permease component
MSTRKAGRQNSGKAIGDFIPDVLIENKKVAFVESLIFVLIFWQVVYMAWAGFADAFTSPTHLAVETATLIESMRWTTHLAATLYHVFGGFTATVILGTVFGVALGWFDFWERAFQDYLTFFLVMPSLFAAIFSAMWFGIGDTAPMVASVVIAFPFLAQNVYEGTKNIDNELINMGRAFDISRRRMIKRVVVQSVLPSWFAGIRYALALSWKISNLTEFIASGKGIGYMIRFEMRVLDLGGTLSWVVFFVGFLMLIEYGVFNQLEKRLFAWREETSIGWG